MSPCIDQPCKIDKNFTQFYLLGDWGGLEKFPYYTHSQHEVEKLMVRLADQRGKPEFLLALGDNFYHNGVKNVNDERFKVRKINFKAIGKI